MLTRLDPRFLDPKPKSTLNHELIFLMAQDFSKFKSSISNLNREGHVSGLLNIVWAKGSKKSTGRKRTITKPYFLRLISLQFEQVTE